MFSAIDIIRIGAGLVLFNAVLSYWFTESSTWGYHGRLVDPKYYKFMFMEGIHNMTRSELALYNGSDPRLPVYVSIGNHIYDVSASRTLYTPPWGRYAAMAGNESARMLVTGCLGKQDELTGDLRGLDESKAKEEIRKWQQYYNAKSQYWLVGYLMPEDYSKHQIPKPCRGPNKVPKLVRQSR